MDSIGNFGSLNELYAQVLDLPVAEYKHVHVGATATKVLGNVFTSNGKDVDGQPLQKFVAVVNKTTGEVATIVSNQYEIVQHKDAFSPLVEALKVLGVDVEGRIRSYDDGNGVRIEATFKDKKFGIEGDSEYLTGFIVQNSYNTVSSLLLRAFGKRLVCSNGMTVTSDVIKALKRKHIGEINVVREYKSWIKRLLDRIPEFQRKLELAHKDLFDIKEINLVLQKAGVPETIIKKIRNRVLLDKLCEERGKVSRNDIYNGITWWVAHKLEGKKTIDTEDRYQQYANKVLTADRQVLLAVSPKGGE